VVINQSALFNASEQTLFVIGVIVLGVLMTVVIWREFRHRPWADLAFGLIIGGASANILDRLIYGGVIDYLPFLQFSTFNVADAEIVLGALLLVIMSGAKAHTSTDQEV